MYNYRHIFLVAIFLIATLALTYRAFVLMAGPENTNRADLITVSRTPLSFTKLQEHMKELEEMSGNINQYTLGEIRKIAQKTTTLVNAANIELKAQHESWGDIKAIFESDAEKFIKLRLELDDVQRLNNKELLRVKKLIDDADKPTLVEELRGTTLSFILGVGSSLAATYVFGLFWRKRRE